MTLPSIRDNDAWAVPASTDDMKAAATFLLAACEPAALDNPNRAGFIARMLATRDYTRAELAEVMREAPFRNHFGQGLKLDVVQTIVDESRTLRAKLARPITAQDVASLLDRMTHEGAKPEHFPCCGFNERNEPLYRYAPHIASAAPNPTVAEAPGRNDQPPSAPFVRNA